MKQTQILKKFYKEYNESERLFKSKSHSIEYHTNMYFLKKLLPKKAKIIELWAGHGTYSIKLAELWYNVTATDIVPEYVDAMQKIINKKKIKNITTQIVDATDLSKFKKNEFDAVLIFGPYYHLRTQQLRKKLLQEAKKIVKKSGFIALAYINRNTTLAYYSKYNTFFSKKEYQELLKKDYKKTDYSDTFLNISFFTSPEEIEKEIKEIKLKTKKHYICDGLYCLLKEHIEKATNEQFDAILDYHIKQCEIPSNLWASLHNTVIIKK